MRMEDNKDSMEEVWQKLKEKGVPEETWMVGKEMIEREVVKEILKQYGVGEI